MTWIGRDALGRITDFTAQATSTDMDTPPNITVAGGEQTIRLQVSAAFPVTTPGLINPDDSGLDSGITIPAGSYLLSTSLRRTAIFDQAGYVAVYAGPDTDNAALAARFEAGAGSTGTCLLWAGNPATDVGDLRISLPRLVYADGVDYHIYLALWPLADDPTTGGVQLVAVLAEPAG